MYETFNMASKWGLPLLIMLENNLYAQSTSQRETLAGDICARAQAFGIRTSSGSTWEHQELGATLRAAADHVRTTCSPAFVRVDTYRLAAHSKGDDDRDSGEIRGYAERDPVNRLISSLGAQHERVRAARERVEQAVTSASSEAAHGTKPVTLTALVRGGLSAVTEVEAGTQLEAINRALRKWLRDDERVILLGEDLRAPLRRCLQGHARPVGRISRACHQYAHQRGRYRRNGERTGARRTTADRRDHVRRFSRPVFRPAAQPRCQVPRHVRGAGDERR